MEQDNQPQPNPYITIPDPYKDYQESIARLAELDPKVNEFGRLCYEIFFMTDNGKDLWNILEERFLHSTLVNPTAPQSEIVAVYWAGFTDCIKQFKQLANQHKQRISA